MDESMEPMLPQTKSAVPTLLQKKKLRNRHLIYITLLLACASLLATLFLAISCVDRIRIFRGPSVTVTYDTIDNGPVEMNFTKVATILEPRMSAALLPTLVSYLAIVPADWPFVFWCSEDNINALRSSAALAPHIASGRLNLTLIPSFVDIGSGEKLSRFLTKPWFWDQFDPEAEWMLFFQNDAVLCSSSEQTVDDWIGYDWVGSPTVWSANPGHGGNGGLSMRRISTMQKMTAIEDPEFIRKDYEGEPGSLFGEAEDWWFMTAIDKTLGDEALWPERDGRDQNDFSATYVRETLRPLGVHKGSGPLGLFGEGSDAAKQQLLSYCPELALIIDDENGRFDYGV